MAGEDTLGAAEAKGFDVAVDDGAAANGLDPGVLNEKPKDGAELAATDGGTVELLKEKPLEAPVWAGVTCGGLPSSIASKLVAGGVFGGGGGTSAGFNPLPNENPVPFPKPFVVVVVVVPPNENGLLVSGLGAAAGAPNEKLGFGASCLEPKENENEGVCVPGVEVDDPAAGGAPRPMPPKGLVLVAGSGALVVVGVGAVKENDGACVAGARVGIVRLGADGAVTGGVTAGAGVKVKGDLASATGVGTFDPVSFAIPPDPNREGIVWVMAAD